MEEAIFNGLPNTFDPTVLGVERTELTDGLPNTGKELPLLNLKPPGLLIDVPKLDLVVVELAVISADFEGKTVIGADALDTVGTEQEAEGDTGVIDAESFKLVVEFEGNMLLPLNANPEEPVGVDPKVLEFIKEVSIFPVVVVSIELVVVVLFRFPNPSCKLPFFPKGNTVFVFSLLSVDPDTASVVDLFSKVKEPEVFKIPEDTVKLVDGKEVGSPSELTLGTVAAFLAKEESRDVFLASATLSELEASNMAFKFVGAGEDIAKLTSTFLI